MRAQPFPLPSVQQLLSIEAPPSPLSSRPERTRISYHTALDDAACAPFRKERRMKFDNATVPREMRGSVVDGSAVLSSTIQLSWKHRPPLYHPDRVAQPRDLQFSGSLVEMFFNRSLDSEKSYALLSGLSRCALFPELSIHINSSWRSLFVKKATSRALTSSDSARAISCCKKLNAGRMSTGKSSLRSPRRTSHA